MRPYPLALALAISACSARGEEQTADTAVVSPTMLGAPLTVDSSPRTDSATRTSSPPIDLADSARRGTGASTPGTPRAPSRATTQPVGSDSLPSRTGTPRDTTAPVLLPNARPAGTIMVDVNRLPSGDSARRAAPLPPEPSLEKKPSRAAADSAAARRRRDSTAPPASPE